MLESCQESTFACWLALTWYMQAQLAQTTNSLSGADFFFKESSYWKHQSQHVWLNCLFHPGLFSFWCSCLLRLVLEIDPADYFGILIKHSGSGKGQPPLHIKGSLQFGLLALSKGKKLCLQDQMDCFALWGRQISICLEACLLVYWDLYTGLGRSRQRNCKECV